MRTLTRDPDQPNPFGDAVEAARLQFSDPDELRRSMQGAGVFYNTYWMRYEQGGVTFDHVVENTKILFDAAKKAGVRKDSPLLRDQPIAGFRAGLLQGKVAGGGSVEKLGNILRHHQAHAGFWRRRTCC